MVTNKILEQVKKTICENNMFVYGDTVVVGVSGGADSVTLLHILKSIRNIYGLNIIVAHINHMIRGKFAERDVNFVRNLCTRWNFKFYLKEVDIPKISKEQGISEELAGHNARYAFFNELADKYSAKIATAHNANDNVETVLMNLMRGTTLQGLSGIAYKSDNLVRPILDISRDMIEQYIEENNLLHITDDTNFETVYTRNKIRIQLIPEMQKLFNPNLIETVSSNIKGYKDDAALLQDIADTVYNNIVVKTDNSISFRYFDICNQYISIMRRIVYMTLQDMKSEKRVGVSTDVIDNICSFILNYETNIGKTISLCDNIRVRFDYKRVVFEYVNSDVKDESIEGFIVPDTDTNIKFENNSNVFISCEVVTSNEIENTPNVLYLPYKEYKGKTLNLRTRRNGDVFRLNCDSHKKLNRILTDKKISEVDRDKIFCVVDGKEILWAFGVLSTKFSKRSGKFIKMTLKNA